MNMRSNGHFRLFDTPLSCFRPDLEQLRLLGEIHNAARDGDLEKVKALLKDNPDLVFSKDTNGTTPLHWAAINGHKDVASLLLANKAAVNAKDNSGNTRCMTRHYMITRMWRIALGE